MARSDIDVRFDIYLAFVVPIVTPRQGLDIVFTLEEMDNLLSIDVLHWLEASSALKVRIIAKGKVLYKPRKIEAVFHQS